MSKKMVRHTPTNYGFTDESFGVGLNYYRLKQVDYNGTVETFNTVALLREFEADLLLFPNPANSIVSLQAKNDLLNPRINIENALGTIVYQNSFQTAKSFVLNLDLVPGIYWVSIAYEDELTTKRLIIQ